MEEVGNARCIGMEGDLPQAILTGEEYPYVDSSTPDGQYSLSIEYDEDIPTIFMGRWVKYGSLQLDDEGKDW